MSGLAGSSFPNSLVGWKELTKNYTNFDNGHVLGAILSFYCETEFVTKFLDEGECPHCHKDFKYWDSLHDDPPFPVWRGRPVNIGEDIMYNHFYKKR